MPDRIGKSLRMLLAAAGAAGAAWVVWRFLLPWAAPFLVSFAAAALVEPVVRALTRRGVPRRLSALLLTLLLSLAIFWGAASLCSRALSLLSELARQTPALIARLEAEIRSWEERLLSWMADAPEPAEGLLRLSLEAAAQALGALPAHLSEMLLDALARLAQGSPGAALFAVTALVGMELLSAAYPQTLAFLSAQLPAALRERLGGLGADLKKSFGGWLRAQALLMGVTFAQLLAAFLLLRLRAAALMAFLVAFVDALPVFGAGVVLVPWALGCLLLGERGRAAGLLLTWGIVWLVRSAAQARLVGDSIGLNPLASLLAVYVGWRCCGVWGMLLFPLLLVTLCRLNDQGVVHLWNTV